MVGLIFVASGWRDLTDSNARSENIGMNKPFTIPKKIFVWHRGFSGKSGTDGWSYETRIVAMSSFIATTGGRNLSVTRLFR